MPPPATDEEKVTREAEKAEAVAKIELPPQPAKSWTSGDTKGNARVSSASNVEVELENGKTSQCLIMVESVVKDGNEVKQNSTVCQNEKTGAYERVDVKPV